MTRKAQAIAHEISSLSKDECAELALLILQKLDFGNTEDTLVVDAEWVKEIDRRMEEVESGRVKCVDGDKVLRRVRNRNK